MGKNLHFWKEEKKKVRTMVWHESREFVIVLENNKDSYALITAYVVSNEYSRKKLHREYEEYIKTGAPI